MAGATEIYICHPGQAIREGRVEYGSMDNRGEAESDAERRLRLDPSIAKIAYYAVNENGDFKCLYTKDNPHARRPKPPQTMGEFLAETEASLQAKRKPTLFERIRAFYEED